MILLRVCYGVVRGLLRFWIGWSSFGIAVCWIVWPAGLHVRLLVACAISGPLMSLIVHEYGHARMAAWLNAKEIRLVAGRLSIAVAHEGLGAGFDALVALCGPAASFSVSGVLFLLAAELGQAALLPLATIVGIGAASLVPWAHDGRKVWSMLVNPRRWQKG